MPELPEEVLARNIQDNALRMLLHQWLFEEDLAIKEKLKDSILRIIEGHERNSFLARFLLRDFETWHKVLTEEESNPEDGHDAKFFEPHLIAVLCENDGKLSPLLAIEKVLGRVKYQLALADFALTASKRFRYDTTIRFLADSLKKRGILSTDKSYKNKLWALSDRTKANCKRLTQTNG